MQPLQFGPFASAADPSFWHALTRLKLERFKLSAESVDISGYYTAGERPNVPLRCTVGGGSFEAEGLPRHAVPLQGRLHNTNTMEEFRGLDPTAAAKSATADVWGAITSGAALKDSSLLQRFALNTFADLKKYHFYFWFAFPVVVPGAVMQTAPPSALASFFSAADGELAAFIAALAAWRDVNPRQCAFVVRRHGGDTAPTIGTLAEWPDLYVDDIDQFAVGFVDPCALPTHPGWPLRNVLAAVAIHFGSAEPLRCTVLAVRATAASGLVLRVEVPHVPDAIKVAGAPPPGAVMALEKDKKGRLRPRTCNLSASMDPVKLAKSAVGLNLSLMRWRLMPSIDLPKVAGTRCLLFGAGTLGCNVARLLLGWGVSKITFVDNGTVSYSNPVRQTLFTFEDSKEGRSKAEAAAARLREIYPGVDATGVSATVPMPGHPVSGETEKAAVATAEMLDALVAEHDAVFLLMDSREARWLPTVLCAARDKMCFTAAIGFDTYVAMRHGVSNKDGSPGRNVGCYFCNDVVAPTNSTKDRSLDQQCTVSRPGCSMMVSAAVVEMLVSILHHPNGFAAPRPSAVAMAEGGGGGGGEGEGEGAAAAAPKGSPLGAVPHQIRGMLAEFGQMTLDGEAFSSCTGCSPTVVAAYRKSLPELLLGACNTPNFLEDLSGLSALHAGVDDLDLDWDEDDDDFDVDDD